MWSRNALIGRFSPRTVQKKRGKRIIVLAKGQIEVCDFNFGVSSERAKELS